MLNKELEKILQPPDVPLFSGTKEQWQEAETALGIQFPDDYVDFKSRYGSGVVRYNMETIYLSHPFGPDGLDVSSYESRLFQLQSLSEIYGETEHEAYADSEGLFPIASDTNSRMICWNVRSDREVWDAVVTYTDEPEYEIHDGPMIQFLTSLFAGRIESEIFSDDIFTNPSLLRFEPSADLR